MFSAGAGRIPVFRNQQCLLEKRACLITGADPSRSFRMTFYRSLSLNAVAKMGNGTVRQSKKSITLMTSYRFPHHNSRSFTFVQDDVLPSSIIKYSGKNGTYKDKTCYVLSPKTAHSKKCFRPSPCGGRRKRFSDRIISLPLKKRMPLFQTYASEVSCYITLRETSSPERFAQAPAFISFTMPFIRLYSPSMRRRSSIFLVRRSLE